VHKRVKNHGKNTLEDISARNVVYTFVTDVELYLNMH